MLQPPQSGQVPFTVLIVDDSKSTRQLLKTMMTSLFPLDPAYCMEVTNGADAVQIVSQQPVHLVLMDLYLPKMSGVEAMKELRKMGATMPVIMVSSEREHHFVVAALNAGANDYIIKPVESQALIQKISKWSGLKATTPPKG